MADDDGGDWFADGGDDPPPPEPKSLLKKSSVAEAAAPAGDAAAAEGGEAPAGDAAPAEEKPDDGEGEYLDPDKFLIFKHWIRPQFLQYKYLYDYRRNYYDDVIDYLDKRQRGLRRDIPRPQTWAERALRTYTSKINKFQSFRQALEDTKLVTQTKLSGAFHSYHSRAYFNRRYSTLLY